MFWFRVVKLTKVLIPVPESVEVEPEADTMEEQTDPPKPGDWAVWITTGSNEGAATMNAVFLSVYGDDEIFGDIPLNADNHVVSKDDAETTKLFDRSSTNQFKVRILVRRKGQ